jgi:hypothetical protein
MTRCRNCGDSLADLDVACAACGEATDERLFLTTVAVSVCAALIFHLMLRRFGVSGRPLVAEVLATSGVGAGTIYVLLKLIQKALAPHRRIFDEMVAVFGDRFGRCLLVVLVLVFFWKALPAIYLRLQGFTLRPVAGEALWYATFRNIRGEAGLMLAFLGVAALVRQGGTVLDFRVANTMAKR